MAKIYNKVTGGVNEQNLILGARESFTYPFDSTHWKDLRAGAFLSLTKTANDDDPTALAETITNPATLPPQDRYWIGFKTSDGNLPVNSGTVFIGFTNSISIGLGTPHDAGDSVLVSSDIGLGTATNQYFWRMKNGQNPAAAFASFDGLSRPGAPPNTGFPHFPQVPGSAGGYATFIGIQLLRANGTSTQVTAKIYKSGSSSDMLFSNTPTADLVTATLDQWSTTLVSSGQMTLSAVPDALFFYSPFHNSRLRIHACGVLRAL
jgi:hypothetical protein